MRLLERARLIEQWNENHHREPMTVGDEAAVVLALFDEEQMSEAASRRADADRRGDGPGRDATPMSSFGHQTACDLLGLAGNGAGAGYRDLLLAELARASEKRAQVIALAMVLGAAEHGVRDVQTWQSAEGSYWVSHGVPLAARYLAWLAEHTEYALSGIEAEGRRARHRPGRQPQRTGRRFRARPDNDGEPGETESQPERDSTGQDRPSR